MDLNVLGVRIREERMKLNLTQEQLAEKVGVSKNFMSLIENGSNMSLETVINLANVFGVTVDHLLSDLVKGDPDQMIDQICSLLKKMNSRERLFILNVAREYLETSRYSSQKY